MITLTKLREVIQKNVELPETVAAKLAQDLLKYINPTLKEVLEKANKVKGGVDLSIKDLEELLAAIQKLKEIHSSIEPKYVEDTLYVDQLKQLEFKLSEILFKA